MGHTGSSQSSGAASGQAFFVLAEAAASSRPSMHSVCGEKEAAASAPASAWAGAAEEKLECDWRTKCGFSVS